MDSRGYRLQPGNPDLIINFRVFEKRTKLRAYQEYGSTFWGPHEYKPTLTGKSGVIEAGTLILCMVDRVRNVLVWEGSASGLIDKDAFLRDEGKIREAVSLMFEDYNGRVAEYTRR